MALEVDAVITLRTSKSKFRVECINAEHLMETALHHYIQEHGTVVAKQKVEEMFGTYRPDYEGHEDRTQPG